MWAIRCPDCGLVNIVDGESRPSQFDCPGCGTIFRWDPDTGKLTIFVDKSSIDQEPPEAEDTYGVAVGDKNRLPAPVQLQVKIKEQDWKQWRRNWRRRRNVFLVAGGIFLALYLYRSLVVEKDRSPEAFLASVVVGTFMGLIIMIGVEVLLARAKWFARFGQKAFGTAQESALNEAAERLRQPAVRHRTLPSGDGANRPPDENITHSPSQGTIQPAPKPEEPTDA
jgi:hypothetical protein